MSKLATPATLSPFLLATGQGVYAEDLAEVAAMVAFAGAHCPEHLAGSASGAAQWAGGDEASAHGQTITGSSTPYAFMVDIPDHADTIRVAARLYAPVGTTVTCTFTVGGAAPVTLTHVGAVSAADYTTDIATSGTGVGLQDVTIATARTAGGGTGELKSWGVYSREATSLPDPPNE